VRFEFIFKKMEVTYFKPIRDLRINPDMGKGSNKEIA